MRTQRQREVMNQPETDVVRTTIMLLVMLGAAACEYESAGVAAGLTAESLPQVRYGMSRAEVLRLLGRPLSERAGVLTYARSRSVSVGNHFILQPAQDCGVLLERDLVSKAYFSDAHADVRCSCRSEACGDEWASECLRVLR